MGCLVVEAALQSGWLIAARMALEQGGEVFAIPGAMHSPHSKGCHALIEQGAELVECAQGIVDELGYFLQRSKSPLMRDHPLLVHFGFDPIELECLAQRRNLTVSELSAILSQREVDGHVASVLGGLYQHIT